MKKILCIILSLLTILNTFATVEIVSFGVSDNVSLSTFVSATKEMIDEYGLYEGSESNSFQTFSAEETENEFKTRRLIIKSDSDIDTLNAISVVSGFRNLWVLQFETEEDTATAYKYYCSLDSIEFVEADSVVTVSVSETVTTITSQSDFLSWGPEHIGFDELNEIITENSIELETVYVAVIDTGVDYNHEFLKDRVEKTTFNSSDTGKINDPLDDNDHGTHVAGIIADCTLDNVIIKPYKCLNSKGEGTDLTISAGIYQAADDENDVINMSFGASSDSPLVEDALAYAKEKNDPVMVAAMGNDGTGSLNAIPLPAKSPLVIGVSAINKSNEKLSSSNFSKDYTELTAPGGTINSTVRNNGQKEKSGTSMATPFVSSVAAIAKALYPYYNSETIRKLMQETAITLTTDIENSGHFGYGMVYATGILRDINNHNINCSQSPIFSFEEGLYDEPIVLEFFCEEGTETYYTTDGSIPTKASLPYDGKPITISESTLVMAASYKDSSVKSPISSAYYGIPRVSGYPIISVIIQNGYVHFIKKTDYTEFEIPEIYKDMVGNVATIKGIYSQAFQDRNFIKYMKMPDTVTEIQTQAFESCVNLKTVIGNGVEIIGDEVFLNCSSLNRVYIENAQSVGDKAFKNCSSLQEINLPNVTNIGDYVFSGCENLRKIDLSGIKKIDSENVFANVSPDFVDLRSLESTKSLPNNSAVLFSSKLSEIECLPENLTIYGTKGTYAEEYANENGYTFIPVPYVQNDLPDTAVISDTLNIDAIGVNTQYQWYGANSPKYRSGVAIEGATQNNFDIDKYKQYRYYYCIVTSNDYECQPIEYVTAMCNNLSYVYTPPTSNGRITIATPTNRYIKYGESINLYANATGLPEGAKIKWRIVEGSGVTLDPSVSGKICTVTSKSNGDVIIEAYAVDKNGNTIVNENGNRICGREGVSSEVSLWWIILYYIRQMFSITTTAIMSINNLI